MTASEPRSILVTGGSGFIGSHLVEALVRIGKRVIVVDDGSTGRRENLAAAGEAVEQHTLDLVHDDLAPVLRRAECDVVFHLAGGTDVAGSIEEPRLDLEKNAVATLNVLRAVREAAPQAAIVNASSAAVYGFSSDSPWSEEALPLPAWPYSISKLAAEHYVAVAPRLYGVRTASLRLFHVFGPRLRRQVVYDLMRKLTATPGEVEIQGDGTEILDLSYVTDVVAALLLVASKGALNGEVYNVASGIETTVAGVARSLCRSMGVEPRFTYTGVSRPGTPPAFRADTSRLRALGFRPHVSLEEGLAETVAWFKAEAARR
jgi:UDP-glucose 4-epimerase